jgi:plasmid stabilization system protein ParE
MEISFRILWSDFAINQLKAIYDYHLIKATYNIAQRLIQKIIDATILLENNPKTGRKEDLLETRSQEFRFIIVKNYKIIYWVDYEFSIINISMVFDTRQDPKQILKIDHPL